MRFDNILLLGSGKIACDCVSHLRTIVNAEKLCVLETADSSVSMLKKICLKNQLKYFNLLKKEEIESFIIDFVADKKTLVISANNRFIFTPKTIKMPDTEIINFHYALLPHYRGMNIPTWVIFNGEKKTGVTWHFVTEQVDHGRVIIQKEIPITEKSTAFEIARAGMVLGIEVFKEFIGGLLEHPIVGNDVLYDDSEPVYKNKSLPIGGVLFSDIAIDVLDRTLRSFDWGKMEVIRKPYFVHSGKCFIVSKYKIEAAENANERKVEFADGNFIVQENKKQITMQFLECDEMTTKEILSKVNELKNTSRGVQTNSYLNLPHCPMEREWGGAASFRSVFFVNKTDGVERILFYTLDFADFSELFESEFNGVECVIEVMGRNPEQFQNELSNMNFSCIARQQRLSSVNASFCFGPKSPVYEYKMAEDDCFAKEVDAPVIHEKLHYVFDTRVSHLQTIDEVKKSIEKKEYSVIKNDDGEIQTLLQAAVEPKSFYINQVFNFGEKIDVHRLLKRRLFDYAQNGGKYMYSWVDENNIASQKFHAKYGMKHDGVWNCVYKCRQWGGVRISMYFMRSPVVDYCKEAA